MTTVSLKENIDRLLEGGQLDTAVAPSLEVQELVRLHRVVSHFFEGNADKTQLWFKSPNPFLGNISPVTMIRLGKLDRLGDFIDQALAANQGREPSVDPSC